MCNGMMSKKCNTLLLKKANHHLSFQQVIIFLLVEGLALMLVVAEGRVAVATS